MEEEAQAIHNSQAPELGTGYAPVPGDVEEGRVDAAQPMCRKRVGAAVVACFAAAAIGAAVALSRRSGTGPDGASVGAAKTLDVPLNPPATWTSLGDGRRCLLSEEDSTPDAAATARKREGVPSAEACQAMCETWPGVCKGIDYSHDEQTCYLWTQRIGGSKAAAGHVCMQLELAAQKATTCYNALKWDNVVKDQGKELAVIRYSNLNDCAVACKSMDQCHSFTVCSDWQKCFLKDKNVSRSDIDSMEHVGFGCESFLAVACEDPPPVSDQAKELAAKAPAARKDDVKLNMFGDEEVDEAEDGGDEGKHKPDEKPAKLRFAEAVTRADYTWRAYSHFDLPELPTIETKPFQKITEAEKYAEQHNFDAFVWREGTVSFKKPTSTLTVKNLLFVGEAELGIFFSFGPPEQPVWQNFTAHDFAPPPAYNALGEVVDASDIGFMKSYAERHGYAGFTMFQGRAHMKFAGRPLAKKDVVEGSPDLTFYQLDFKKPPIGNAAEYYPHDLPPTQGGAADNQDCRASKSCNNPSMFCFRQNDAVATCRSTCDVKSGWSCQVLGKPKIPNLGLFCFALATTADLPFLKQQFEQKQGIALCDEAVVFAPTVMQLAQNAWTVALPGFGLGSPGTPQAGKPSLMTNLAAWMFVIDHFYYRTKLWTVKVDPQAAFFPNEFKARMRQEAFGLETAERGFGLYLAGCQKGFDATMTASMQALSQRAMIAFSVRRGNCTVPPNEAQSVGEWFEGCLDKVQVAAYKIKGLTLDQRCPADAVPPSGVGPAGCDFSRSLYYPMANPAAWQACLTNAVNHHQ